MPNLEKIKTDVLVVGGGNAALCAAMTARETGVKVLLLESAPKHFRGGNSRHTRNIRYLHARGNDCLSGPYLGDEFWDDLLQARCPPSSVTIRTPEIFFLAGTGIWSGCSGA